MLDTKTLERSRVRLRQARWKARGCGERFPAPARHPTRLSAVYAAIVAEPPNAYDCTHAPTHMNGSYIKVTDKKTLSKVKLK